MAQPLLEARGLTKRFGHVRALQDADFTAYPGEAAALVGDSGAGKSSLVKTLPGAIRPDGGQILVDGGPVELAGPLDARRYGIETVCQDLALAPGLDAAADLHLGRELFRGGLLGRPGVLDRAAVRRSAVAAFAERGADLQDVGALGRQGVDQALAAIDKKKVTTRIGTDMVAITKANTDQPGIRKFFCQAAL
ncbi:ATP-binding cassette domain-containing protein [Streptomyces sp. IBSBF 2435]|uniref:ATP-binding cassette domain-containing protein n=1 Tax=Streptomyces sp. IBSBF 2435 TaxID=2903531 RepID=UPI002FDC3FF8